MVRSDQEVDETEKQVARCKPEGLDALCRTTKFTRKELQIMYRGFKNVSTVHVFTVFAVFCEVSLMVLGCDRYNRPPLCVVSVPHI